MIRFDNHAYELIKDHKEGWNAEAFRQRYMDLLDKFDFIVGDWGYGQLRLKGFYHDFRKHVPFDMKISFLDEYLKEYCNFGCSYFVLQRLRDSEEGGGEQPKGGEDGEWRQVKQSKKRTSSGKRRPRRSSRSRHRPQATKSSQKEAQTAQVASEKRHG